MTKFLILLVLAGMLIAGCTSAESLGEHSRRLNLTTDLQARTMIEDWDSFWLYDRNCRMSRWHTRTGY